LVLPTFLLVTLLIPAVPTIIGAMLGTLLTIGTARMKKRNIMNILGQLLLVFVIMFFSFA
jgi:high-affinity K+ transport system ATPase subunit B